MFAIIYIYISTLSSLVNIYIERRWSCEIDDKYINTEFFFFKKTIYAKKILENKFI